MNVVKFQRGISVKKSLEIGNKEIYLDKYKLLKAFSKLNLGMIHSMNETCISIRIPGDSGHYGEREEILEWFRQNTYYYIVTPGKLLSRIIDGIYGTHRKWKFTYILMEDVGNK